MVQIEVANDPGSLPLMHRASERLQLSILRRMSKDVTRLYMYVDFEDLGKYHSVVHALRGLERKGMVERIRSYPRCYRTRR